MIPGRFRLIALILATGLLLGSGVGALSAYRTRAAAGPSGPLAPGWTNVSASAAPVPMAGAMMAYSSRADRFVLFGGWDGTQGLNGTWVFDPANRTWAETHPSASPIARGDEMFVYDDHSDLFILFGGWYEFPNGSYRRLSDTWTFSLGTRTWTERHPSASPSPRSDAEVAYDPASEAVLLVGGFSGTAYLGDVWAYFPGNDSWWPRPSVSQPSARADGRMVYVASQSRFLLFGGNDYSGPNLTFHHLADTWSYAWATNAWSLVPAPVAPPARDYPIFALDPGAGVALLTSGFGNRTILNDLWAFNLTTDTWTDRTPSESPPPRFAGAGGFDSSDGIFVVFSGAGNTGLLQDTWFYAYANPAPVSMDWLGVAAVGGVVAAVAAIAVVAVLRRSRKDRSP